MNKENIIKKLNEARLRQQEQEALHIQQEGAKWREFKVAQQVQDEFLKAARPVPTPALVYAIWLYTWLEQGNEVTHVRNFDYVGKYLTPTAEFPRIPLGYGALLMNLLVVPSVADGDMTPYTDRKGWEFGHTKLLTLEVGKSGLIATTNQPNQVESFPDIERIIESLDVNELGELGTKIKELSVSR